MAIYLARRFLLMVPTVSVMVFVIMRLLPGDVVTLMFQDRGYGVPPPHRSWGGMLTATGCSYMVRAPWLSMFPGLALTLAIAAFNIIGDALRDLLDPRLPYRLIDLSFPERWRKLNMNWTPASGHVGRPGQWPPCISISKNGQIPFWTPPNLHTSPSRASPPASLPA